MKINLTLITAFLVFSLSSGCVSKKKYETQVTKYRKLKMEYETLKQKIESVKKELKLKTANVKRLNKKISDLKNQIKDLETKFHGVKGKAGQLESKLKATFGELEELRKARAEAEQRAKMLKKLKEQFMAMIRAGNLEVLNINGRLVIKLKAAILFAPGRVKVKKEGKKALKDIARVLAKMTGKHFQVAGHTDNDPVKHSKYKDNWLLSAARAVNVVRVLQQAGVPGKMLSAAGYAEFQPIKPNTTPENKKFNRRIEIQIIPAIPSILK